MSQRVVRSRDFTAERAWGALDIANLDGTTVRLHWTDQPYEWHVNDGAEVFLVLEGAVEVDVRLAPKDGVRVRSELGAWRIHWPARTDLDLLTRGELREHGGEDRGLGEAGAGLRGHRTSLPDPASQIAPVPSVRASST